ncbi:transglutaminase family protein [Microbulbifer sp. JMSA004]|uniref:transglutaminase-like domain-containing protein n=1 Tax=unclassified Microbulbifer TaxID=2619833 RepID=UPI0024ADD992|nr:transglutaminase domain-containing protein [Microbulbifer sp. VAAF005]WHI46154.1 transglutaminase domain-containing protein [Microbulbifer sp. VAAF005]
MLKTRIFASVLSFFIGLFGCSSLVQANSRPVTLSAQITIQNTSGQDAIGYIQRLSIPVEHGLQQSLKEVRYDYSEGLTYRKHKKGDSKYLEFTLDIPAGATVTRRIDFDLILSSYNYAQIPRGREPFPDKRYLQSSKYIESDSLPIKKLSLEIQNTFMDEEGRLRAAFLMPQAMIEYKIQPTKGALAGLESREGDCTEYASLFVALARSMGYPARTTSEFLFTKRKIFKQPNHHAAEVYTNGRWIPVDPNLAQEGRFGYGFGKGKISKITLTRDFTWVWSNLWPKSFKGNIDKTKVSIEWSIR